MSNPDNPGGASTTASARDHRPGGNAHGYRTPARYNSDALKASLCVLLTSVWYLPAESAPTVLLLVSIGFGLKHSYIMNFALSEVS